LLALAWSAAAVFAASLRGRGERIAITLGPALAAIGLVGIAISINGTLIAVIAAFTVVTGLGVGLCMSHLMSWTMTLAAEGEESITASSIHTVRSLGVAVGAAGAGLIANAAGLGDGVTVESVTLAVTWVNGIAALAPASAVLLGVLLIAHRRRHDRAQAPATAVESAAE
jgi:MFS family permease